MKRLVLLRGVVFFVLFLVLALSGQTWAVPPSPELIEKLKKEGRLQDWIKLEKLARERGVDQPNPHPPILGKSSQADTLKPLVICVDFSDNLHAYDTSEFYALLLSQGSFPTGSLRDYFLENSYGKLDLVGGVTGWYRMPQTYSYYVDNQGGHGIYPNNAQKLAEDAVNAADPDVNFSDYDHDGDGWVDALIIVFAGPSSQEMGSYTYLASGSGLTSDTLVKDGVKLWWFGMGPERLSYGSRANMGIFAHLFGTDLGLVPLLDYDNSSVGVGYWSSRGWGYELNNQQTPAHLDAFSKYALGWIEVDTITSNLTDVEILQIETSGKAYRLWTEGQTGPIYFLVENRQKVGFDSYLPGSGLLIYHVDENMLDIYYPPNNNEWCPGDPYSPHYMVALEQADGDFDLEGCSGPLNPGDQGDPFPGTSNNRAFNDTTTPNSNNYHPDSVTNVVVMNISDSDSLMYADMYVIGTPVYDSFYVNCPSEVPVGPSVFPVNVRNAHTLEPVQFAYVHLWKTGYEVDSAGYTNQYGDITFHPSPSTPGIMHLDVTKEWYHPYHKEITVYQIYEISFADPIDYPAPEKPVCVFTSDLDNNAYQDLAVSKVYGLTGPNGISILKSDCHGIFQAPENYINNGELLSISGGDFDQDTDIDLVVTDFYGNKVSVYPNDGTGNFTTPSHYTVGDNPTSVTAAYLNNDLYPDLAVANNGYYDHAISVLINNATGGFQSAVHYSVGGHPKCIISADLNGDGHQDLAVTDELNDVVCILKNNGSGSFVLDGSYPTGKNPECIFAADLLDQDNDLDLVVANSDTTYISILRNNGSGAFQPAGEYNTAGYFPTSVCAADLDGDTDEDIAVSAYFRSSGKLFIFANDGDNAFIQASTFTIGSSPEYVLTADFERDGDNDIAVANKMSGTISILENLTTTLDYVPGDVNNDGIVNTGDVVYLVTYLYKGGPPPPILNAGDANGDCIINVGDINYLVNYLYGGGPCPIPGCVE